MKILNDNMQKEGVGANVFIIGHKCHRCGHKWVPRNKEDVPEICPKCKSPYWNKPKTKFLKDKNGKTTSK